VITVPGIIDGKEIDGDDVFVDLDPSTGRQLAQVGQTCSAGSRVLLHESVHGELELLFGGTRRSGYGAEKGFEGLLGYTQTKTVVVGI